MKFVVHYCGKSHSDHKIKNFDSFSQAIVFAFAQTHEDWMPCVQLVNDTKVVLTLKYSCGNWIAAI